MLDIVIKQKRINAFIILISYQNYIEMDKLTIGNGTGVHAQEGVSPYRLQLILLTRLSCEQVYNILYR